MLAREANDIGYNAFIGSFDDLENNVALLVKAADLTLLERQKFLALYKQKVKNG